MEKNKMKRKMKTVKQLIEELKNYPQNSFAAAYSCESTGIVIYPSNFYKKQKEFDDALDNFDMPLEDLEKISSESTKSDFIELKFID